MQKEIFNTIVLNLYPLNRGFTIGFNVKSTYTSMSLNLTSEDLQELNMTETKPLSYEENEFLFYVNSGEIPPILIDLIDHINVSTIINRFKLIFSSNYNNLFMHFKGAIILRRMYYIRNSRLSS